MIEIHLYGKLRQHAPDCHARGESVVRLEPQPKETVRTTLERIGIVPDEVFHIFLNGAILATGNSMAPWLKYQQATGGSVGRPVTAAELDRRVHDGDRLGLFARDMALLVV